MKKFKEIIKDGSSAAYGAKQSHQIAGDRKSRYQKCSGAVINALGNIAAFIQVILNLSRGQLSQPGQLLSKIGQSG